MRKEPLIFILHIKDCLIRIDSHLKGIDKKNFEQSIKTQDAVLRRLEIIGEAASKIPVGFKKKYPKIKWKSMVGARNILIHEYFGVNINLVWQIIKKDLPILKKQIDQIIAENKQTVIDLTKKM